MCPMDWLTPAVYGLLLLLFVFFVNRFSKRNKRLYDDSLKNQKDMMDRQKESLELLREIRDVLKTIRDQNNG